MIELDQEQVKNYIKQAKETLLQEALNDVDWNGVIFRVAEGDGKYLVSATIFYDDVFYTSTAVDNNEDAAVIKAKEELRERIKFEIKVALGMATEEPNPLQYEKRSG